MDIIDNLKREKVKLSLEATGLPSMDWFGKSDPFVLVLELVEDKWIKRGLTEIIPQELNPKWEKEIKLGHIPHKTQHLKFLIYDSDDNPSVKVPKNKEIIGKTECELGKIMKDKFVELTIKNDKNKIRGTLKVAGYKDNSVFYGYIIKFGAHFLREIEWFKSCDPFLMISVAGNGYGKMGNPSTYPSDCWKNIKKVNYGISNGTVPNFFDLRIDSDKIKYDDIHHYMRVEVWDHSKANEHQLVAFGFFSIAQLDSTLKKVPLITEKNKPAGNLSVDRFEKVKSLDLNDCIVNGTEFDISIAVDFTISNGAASNPNSFHQLSGFNHYRKAMELILDVMFNFDKEEKVALYGFGAKIKGIKEFDEEEINHCFPLSGDPKRVTVTGIEAAVKAYESIVPSLKFYGPTYFRYFLREVIEKTKRKLQKNSKIYSVLIVLTDGVNTDRNKTINLIAEATKLPISIILVAIGEKELDFLKILDGDFVEGGSGSLHSMKGQKINRDIVHFFRLTDGLSSKAEFAKLLLEELPEQVMEYYQSQEGNK